LWAQRIGKEAINARSRPGGFSVRAAVSVTDVPTKFKPGHMDPREASGAGFEPEVLGWEPQGKMSTEFRRCINQQTAGPRERQLWPETCQQEIGWILGIAGKTGARSEPAGMKPTRLGVGWAVRDGIGGPITTKTAEKAGLDGVALIADPFVKKKLPPRKSKDGNVRETLAVPPYGTQVPCAVWPEEAAKESSQPSVASNRSGKSSSRPRKTVEKSTSLPVLSRTEFVQQEASLGKAKEKVGQYFNKQGEFAQYRPLSNSDVATFADYYTKTWGVGLYSKAAKKGL